MNINYSTDITDVATERETDGDLILSDIGEGLYIEYYSCHTIYKL